MLKKYYGIIIGIFVFIIYQFTMAPTVVGGDAGQLATVQATLGIAHPTGYPLFTLIGHLFYLIPLPLSPILKFNMLASLYCSISVVFIAYIIKLIVENSEFSTLQKSIDSDKNHTTNAFSNISIILTSSFGALLWAFSLLVWFQSTYTEVYSLHICLLTSVIYFALKAYFSTRLGNSELVQWQIVALLLAFSFSNHLTTIYVIPGLLLLLYMKHGFTRFSFKVAIISALITIVGVVLFYSYLIIRSNQGPLLNWGDPSNLTNLFHHISGGQYRGRLFSGLDVTLHNIQYFFETIFNVNFWEFHIGILFSIVGTVILFKVKRKMFAFLFTCILATLSITVNYEIPDINTYFFLIYICLVLLAAIGIHGVSIILSNRLPSYLTISVMGVIVLFFEVNQNYSIVNHSDFYLYEDYTREVLNSVENNAVIIVNDWAPFLYPSYYYQFVEEERRDVTVVCLAIHSDWYKKTIYKLSPDLLDINTNQFNFNPTERPVYVYSQLITELKLPEGFHYKPDLYLFKLENDEEYLELKTDKVSIRTDTKLKNKDFEYIQENICSMLENRALYENMFNKKDKAIELLEVIKNKFPDYTFKNKWESILSNLDSY